MKKSLNQFSEKTKLFRQKGTQQKGSPMKTLPNSICTVDELAGFSGIADQALKSGFFSIKLVILFFISVTTLPISYNAYSEDLNVKDCKTISSTPYILNYDLSILGKISRSTPLGSTVGEIALENARFRCVHRMHSRWSLQIKPNSPPAYGTSNICKTNISGIGIQYMDPSGSPVDCHRWGYIFEVPENFPVYYYGGAVLAKLIRIDGTLDTGEHQLRLPSDLMAYYPGKTEGAHWGSLLNRGSDRIVISTDNPFIFFPESPFASPTVDLGLKSGSNRSMSGARGLDMCLYDGNNSTSKYLSLTFQDEGSSAPGRRPGMFSAYHQGADKSKQENRLDYELSIFNPTTGATELITEGKEIVWVGTEDRRIQRQVNLPSIPGLSYCVPAPLTLKTPAFNVNTKNVGHYVGILRVIYRVPTK